MAFLEITLIICFALFSRLLFILGDSSDQYWHLWFVRIFKQKKLKVYDNLESSLVEGFLGYPCLIHALISYLPSKFWNIGGKILNVILDLPGVIIFYYIASKIYSYPTSFGLSIPGLLCMIYLTTPIFFPVTARLKAMGGRVLGNLVLLLFWICFWMAFGEGYPIMYIICVILGVTIILSSQFAFQFYFLSTLIVSIAFVSFLPILIFILVVISSILSEKVDYFFNLKRILLYFINHYKWYAKNVNNAFTTTYNRGFLALDSIKEIFTSEGIATKFYRFNAWLTSHSTIAISVYSFPIVYFMAVFFIYNPNEIGEIHQTENSLQYFLFILALCGVIGFILTSIKPLQFLGQAERYFEYSAFPTVLLLGYIIIEGEVNIIPYCVFLLLFQIVMIFALLIDCFKDSYEKEFQETKDVDLEQVVEELNEITSMNMNRTINVIPIVTKFSFYLAYKLFSNRNLRFYYNCITNEKSIDGYLYKKKSEPRVNQFVTNDLNKLQQMYSVNVFVVHKPALTFAKNHGIDYDFSKWRRVMQNESFILYTSNELSTSHR